MIGIVCAFFHTEGKGFYSSRQLRLYSRGSADPRESLRRRRISKLALSAHKVLPDQEARSLPLFFAWGRMLTVLFTCLRIRLHSLKSFSVARCSYAF